MVLLAVIWSTNAPAQVSRLLVMSDHDASVDVDGERVGDAKAREPKIFTIFPGEHLLRLLSSDGKYRWSGQITVAPGMQQIFDQPLRPLDPMVPFVERQADARDGYSYRIVTVNAQTWLGENLRVGRGRNFSEPSGERLYDLESARGVSVIPGWHLPKRNEWERLFAAYGSGARAALIKGGVSQIDLRDSGVLFAPAGKPQTWETQPGQGVGCYWMDEGTGYVQAVILRANKIEIGGNMPPYSLCAVRLLRD